MQKEMNLPEPIGNYLRAIHAADADAFQACFAPEAVVRDIGREIRGREAIMEWARQEIFAVNVTLEVLGAVEAEGRVIVTVKVDGTFDRTGLPDPLVMEHRFTLAGDQITELACRLAAGGAKA